MRDKGLYYSFHSAALLCCLAFILFSFRLGAQTTWNGGTGNWSNVTLWSTGMSPDDPTANVDVDGGNPATSTVTVDGTFTVGQITIDAGDSVLISDSETLIVSDGGGLGSIVNNGNLTIDSTGDPTDLSISGMITLSGGGALTMIGNANILGSGTFVNSSVIQGQGNIGNDQIAITNQGLISANATGAALVVAPASGANTLLNTGTMQAGLGGILVLDGNGGGSFDNAGGLIQALDGSQVVLKNAPVTGGTLASSGSGRLVATDGANNFLSGVTVNGNLDLTGTGIERVLDGLVLNGTASIDGGGILAFQETQALSGSATVLFGSNIGNAIAIDSGSTATLTLASGVLIHGQNGTIGQNAFSLGTTRLINNGTIAADVAGGAITVQTSSTDPASITNAGTLEAIDGGTLKLDSNLTNTGIIQAGNGVGVSNLDLSNAIINQSGTGSIVISSSGGLTFTSTELIGGTLSSAVPVVFSSGSGNILSSVNATLAGMTLTSGGVARIFNGGLTLDGTATIDGGGILAFQETQSLTSPATILFGSDIRNALAIDAASSAVLTLGPNVLVHGQNGTVGNTAFTPSSLTRLINEGTIAADNGNGTITIQTTSGDPNSVTNSGTLEAINGGTLTLDSNVTNSGAIQAGNAIGNSIVSIQQASITQTGAGAIAVSSSGEVIFHNSQLTSGALNSAGTLFFTSDGGNILNSVTSTVAEMNLGSSGIVRILNGGLTLNGTANINGGGVFGFQETQTLNGDATILFGPSAFNRLAIDSTSQATLTFNPDVLVHGQNGTIGTPVFIGGSTKLINDGAIAADASGGTISVATTSSAADSVANSGTLEALNGGTLALDSNVTNYSSMEALGGGTLSINNSTVTNTAAIQVGNGVSTSNLDINNAGITQTGSGAITVSSGGGLTLNSGQITGGTLTSAVPLSFSSNSGNILSSVNSTLTGLNLGSSGIARILYGGLTLNGTANINGGGVLGFQETQTLNGNATILFGSTSFNRLAIDSGSSATLTLGPDVLVHGQNGNIGTPVFIGGSTKLINDGTIAADVSGGTISLNPTSSAADSVANSGTMEATNGGTLAIDSNLSNGTTLEAFNGGTLAFNANVTNTGAGQITVTGAGSAIDQNGVTITGGVINQTASGSFVPAQNGNNFLNGLTVDGGINLTSGGDERVLNGLVLNGTANIDTGGVLDFQETQMLSGSGTILFGSSTFNRLGIDSSSTAILTLGPNILVHGQNGTIGETAFIGGTTKLVNDGAIAADGAGGTIKIETSSGAADSVTNNGTIEATIFGTITLSSNLTNSGTLEAINSGTIVPNANITNTGAGQVDVSGVGSSIEQNGITITGGTINQSNSGSFSAALNGANFLNGVTVNGNISLAGDGEERALNGLVLNGTATIDSGGVLDFQETQLLSGSATILFGSNSVNRLGIDSASTATLTLGPGVLVHGQSGIIGQTAFIGGTTKLINNGTISADGAGGSITIETTSTAADSVNNAGTLEATNGGTLIVMSNVTNSGTFEAFDGSSVAMQTGDLLANDSAGILSGGAYNAIATGDGATVTLQGSPISEIAANTEIELSGPGSVVQIVATPIESTLTLNDGTLAVLNNRNYTNTNTLENGGTLQLGGGLLSTPELTNDTAAQVHGFGIIFISGTTDLVNNGTISADVAGGTLTLNTTSTDSTSLTNTGALDAINGGALAINSNITNTGGIQIGNGIGSSHLSLNNLSVTQSGTGAITVSASGGMSISNSGISGGTLTSAVPVIFSSSSNNILSSVNSTLGGMTLTAGGIARIINGSLTLNGTANIGGGGILAFQETQMLSGSATIIFGSNSGNALAIDSTSSATLTLGPNVVIRGKNGTIGEPSFIGGTTKLINNGTISANIAGGTITLNPTSAGADSVNNAGTLQAANGGTLKILSNVTNSGTYEAFDSSSITMQSGALLANDAAGLLTGGVYSVFSTGDGATVTLGGSAVTQIAANTEVILSGSGSVVQFGSTLLENSLTINDGTLEVLGNRNFTTTDAIENSGTLQLGGGIFTALALTNDASSEIDGFGAITPLTTNNGIILVTGGLLTMGNGIQGSGAIQINSGASLDLSGGSTLSTANYLIHNGANLNLGGNDIVVADDYNNANFGVGNTFNPHANVSGTGQIQASGDVAQTLSGNVTSGSTSAATLSFGKVHVGDVNTDNYVITSSGTSGPLLRGAIQTSVNGGNITDGRLSGSGVTPANWGPLATGSSTGSYSVVFDASSNGPLTNQTVYIINNFDNVPGQTIVITGTAYQYAEPGVPASINFGNVHVGALPSQLLTITNNAPDNGYSEALDAAIGSPTTGITTNAGSFNLLLAGGTNSTALAVGITTTTPGPVNGTATITLTSDGAGSSGFGTTALPSQEVSVSGTVYRLAQAGLVAPDSVNFGNVHVGGADPSQLLTITNIATNDGYSEALDALIGSPTTGVTTNNGSVSLLTPGGTNNTALAVGISTATPGPINGMATIDLTSDGAGTSGLGLTGLSSQTVDVTGTVYRLAQADLETSGSINFGNVHAGTTDPSQLLTITNEAPADGYSEALDAVIGSPTAGVTTNGGSFNLLTAGGTNSTAIAVGISTTTAGPVNGTATISVTSDGAGTSGLGNTALTPLSVNVSGKVYRLAQPQLLSPASINFGNFHVGDSVSPGMLTVANAAASDGYSEALDASIGSASTGVITNGGFFNLLTAGETNNFSLEVFVSTAAPGSINGTATINLTSDGAGSSGLGTTALPSQAVNVSGTVYRLAQAGSITPVNLGNVHINAAAPSQLLAITNAAANDGYSEDLDATIGSPTGGITTNNASISLLAPGGTNSTALSVGISTSTAGAVNGTATIDLTSDGLGTSGLGLTALAPKTLNVSGTVYRYAQAAPVTPDSVNFGNFHVGSASPSQLLTISNIAANDGFSESLDAVIGSLMGGATTNNGSVSLLTPGGTNTTALSVGIGTATAGAITGTATISFASDGTGSSGLGTTALPSQMVSVSGTAYRFAQPDLESPDDVNFGNFHVGGTAPSQSLTLSNIAANDGYSEDLDATIGSPAGGITTNNGSISLLTPGGTNNIALSVEISTATAGAYNGTATVDLTSDGLGTSGLGLTALTPKTVNVSGTVYRYAQAAPVTPDPINFGNFHVGGAAPSHLLTISNIATSDGYSESLDAVIGSPIGGATTNNGSVSLLTPGGTNTTALSVGISTSTAGAITGTATISFASDGTGSSGLGTTALPSQSVSVSGTVYRLAQPDLETPDDVNFGNFHVGGTAPSQLLTLSNTAANDGYSEDLDATIGSPTGGVTTNNGSISLLTPGGTNSIALSVGISTATAGAYNGTATIDLTSDGLGTSGLGLSALTPQTVNVSGTVYRYAQAAPVTPDPINFGNFHVGGTAPSHLLTISNIATSDGYSESLDAVIGSPIGGATTNNGSVSLLTPGGTNSTALSVGISTSTAGAITGTATISFASDGTGSSGLGATALPSQSVSVSGAVYRLALPDLESPDDVNLGNFHVGGTAPSQSLTLSNIAANDGYSEDLDAMIGLPTGGVTTNNGSFNLLTPGGTNSTALSVGIITTAAGPVNGTATITLTSDGAGSSGLGDTALPSQQVSVSGTVYRLAETGLVAPNPVNFGNFHVAAADPSQLLTITNIAPSDGYSEALDASIGSPTTGVTTNNGSLSLLMPGGTNSTAIAVGISTATPGPVNGTATIDLTSDGAGTSGLGLTDLFSQAVQVSGTVYRLAHADLETSGSINFGSVHIGAADPSQLLTITNAATDDGYSEGLDAAIGSPTAGIITNGGSFSLLAAGGTNSTALAVGISTTAAGPVNGTAAISLTSDGAGTSGLGATALSSQTVSISGAVYRLAQPDLETPDVVNFGNFHVGDADPAQSFVITNAAIADGYSENLDASIGSPTTGVTTNNGSFGLLTPGGTNSTALAVGISTATPGAINGTATISLSSDGAGSSGLGTTALSGQTVDVTGTVYRLAHAASVTPSTVNFGIIHVGDNPLQAITISNTAPADGFSEKLDAQFGGATGNIVGNGSLNLLAAGGTNGSSLSVGVDTALAGSVSGTATVAFLSDGAGSSGLGTTALPSQTVTVSAQVNNYASPFFLQLSGSGMLTQTGANSFTLNLGVAQIGGPQLQAVLGLENDAAGPADTLAGSFGIDAPDFTLSGFNGFSGITAGQMLSGFDVSIGTGQRGNYSDLITLMPESQNTGGYNGSLPGVELTLEAQVVPEPSEYLLLLSAGAVLFLARRKSRKQR